MKLENNVDCIQVVDSKSDVKSVIQAIIKTGVQEEAFFLCDVGDIVWKNKNWKKLMPRIETYYAVKCNDNIIVLRTLAALGCGFDCASKEEIKKILSLGVQPNRIIFANPTKPVSHIQYAAIVGVSMMTFDSEMELHKIKKFYPNAKMVLRIKYDDADALYSFGKKFGCDHKTEAPRLLALARSLRINVIGVSFHIGSGSQNASVYGKAIAAAAEVFNLAATLGYKFNFLDIGGGYPGEHNSSIDAIAKCVNSAVNLYFSDTSIEIIAEPGKYYVNSAFTLATSIHCKRSIMKAGSGKTQMYYVNSSVYAGLISIIFGEKYPLTALAARPGAKFYGSTVWGQTCDSCDVIAEDVYLPEMDFGDWIVIEDAGAYSLSIGTPFNGFPLPKVHAIVDEKSWLLLKNNLPMEEKFFAVGNEPVNLRSGLDC